MFEATYYNQYRGYAQPKREPVRQESPEEERRRLHREAAEAVKRHAAALREAKARYQEYDRAMAEASQSSVHANEIQGLPKAIET
jgi:hypothetical protein